MIICYKMSARLKYNKDLLRDIVERDKCIIDIDSYEHLNRDIKLKFICNCGTDHVKIFRSLYETGAFCRSCTQIKANEKYKQVFLIKYGVENPAQLQEVQEKIKKTCLVKYGVECPLLSGEVQEKIKATNLERYGAENPFMSEEIREKIKETNLERLGVEYPIQSEEIREKMRNTNLERFGVEYPSQSEEIKEKVKHTNLEKFGVENPFQSDICKEKSKQTCLIKYKVEYTGQSEEIREKMRQTCLVRYGAEYAMQNSTISDRSLNNSFKTKEFIYPDGTIINVQGYEHIAIQILLDLGYNSNDITVSRSEVPEIWYQDKPTDDEEEDEGGKIHRYYCDIYIKLENKIIEVKSEYTYGLCNPLKALACKNAGYNFEYWIIDRDGSYTVIKV
jgi:hypothetical protein